MCEVCGETIGVYEPLVVYTGAGARTTSRAAEPELKATGSFAYHRGCYAALTLSRSAVLPA